MDLSEEEIGRLLNAWKAYINATGEHFRPKDAGVLDLANGVHAWQKIESINPLWREKAPDLPDRARIEFQALRQKALRFEKQLHAALANSETAFFRNLSDAVRLSESEAVQHLDTAGAIVLAWHELGGLDLKRPTWDQLQQWVEARLPKGEPTRTKRQWKRIRKDKYISALLDI